MTQPSAAPATDLTVRQTPSVGTDRQPAAGRGRLPRAVAFWAMAAVIGLFMFASSAPTPLYGVYQAQWRFSALTLTAVFAVYAVTLLGGLLVFGSLSDHVGRRPVVVAALLAEAVSLALFAAAGGVSWLYAARAVQGLATGVASGAVSAGLIDLQPPERPGRGALVGTSAPVTGLALGALGTGLLVRYAPHPTVLVFVVLLALFVVAVPVVGMVPESAGRRPGALRSLRPRITVPGPARGAFTACAPSLAAVWTLSGLYLSLGPSLAAGPLQLRGGLAGSLVVFTLAAGAAVMSVLAARWRAQRATAGGLVALIVGMALTLVALADGSGALFFVGAAVAGIGFGATLLGGFRTVTAAAPPEDRGALIAALYTLFYTAFSVPVVAAGLAATHVGLRTTANVYGAAIATLAVVSLVGLAVRSRAERRPKS